MKNPRSPPRRPEWPVDLIASDAQSPEPLHRQLYLRLVELIMDGSLPFDGRLPSSRALAQKINVSRNTVVSAYQQLEVEGYVQAQRGSQTFVAAAPNRSTPHRIEELAGAKDPLSKRGRQMISQPTHFDRSGRLRLDGGSWLSRGSIRIRGGGRVDHAPACEHGGLGALNPS